MLATGSSWLSHHAVNCPFVRRTVTIISRLIVSVWNRYTPGAEGGAVCRCIRAGTLHWWDACVMSASLVPGRLGHPCGPSSTKHFTLSRKPLSRVSR